MIYLLDSDLGGVESVQDVIDAGLVTHLPIASYLDFRDAVDGLQERVSDQDTVVIDTITSLANLTRGDLRFGDAKADLWANRNLFFGDKNTLNAYQAAEYMIMRPLKNLRALGAHIIVTAHETEQVDPITQTKKRAPALNDAFYNALVGHATDVFRLSIFHDEISTVNEKGEPVVYPAGTRVLYLKAGDGPDGWVAKYHVPRSVSEKLPRGLVDPTMPKLAEKLQKLPGFLVVYAPPGVGKTTLACSGASVLTHT